MCSYIENLPYNENIKQKLTGLVNIILSKVNPSKIILFGSYARMEYTISSDFDILLLTDEDLPRTIRGELTSILDENDSDLVIYSTESFDRSTCLLSEQIRKDGILLWKA